MAAVTGSVWGLFSFVNPMPKSRKKAKTISQQKQTGKHQDGGQHQTCKSDGNARVSGEVGIRFPKDLLDEYHTAQKETEAHNRKQRLIGWLTFGAVVFYTSITAFQWFTTIDALNTAKAANNLTLESVRGRLVITDFQFARPITTGQRTTISYAIKNIGRSQAIYGVRTDTQRWQGMPVGDMPVAEPDVTTPLEPDVLIKNAMIEIPTVTQEYIDGLPTLADIARNPLNGTSRTNTVLAPNKLTTYFFGKLIYESIGPKRELDFCFYIARSGEDTQALALPSVTGDSGFIFSSCPRWNGEHPKQ
jgi:hypothetical protein